MLVFWLVVIIMVLAAALILLDNNYKNLNEKFAVRSMLIVGFLILLFAWLAKTFLM